MVQAYGSLPAFGMTWIFFNRIAFESRARIVLDTTMEVNCE